MFVEPDNQIGGHKPRRPNPLCGQRGLLSKLRQQVGLPQLVAEQLGNPLALLVVLMLVDKLALERLVVKVVVQYDGSIIIDLVPIEAEERLLGLEVADLRYATELNMQARPTAGKRQYGFRQCKVYQLLCIVKVRQAVKCFLLGIGQDGQALIPGFHGDEASRDTVQPIRARVSTKVVRLTSKLQY